MTDLAFHFDPVCPFAWMTSKWVRQVQARRDYTVEWRLISLRLLNSHIDYDAHFPPEYEAGHTAGLRMLRVAAAVRDAEGPAALDPLQRAFGDHIFEVDRTLDAGVTAADERDRLGRAGHVATILAAAGLDEAYVDALEDTSWDAVVREETDAALALTGKDVGTPIIQIDPPDGVAFFGPVISRLPDPEDAEVLWDHVVGLARFPSFAEMKRSLRELPQLPALGVRPDEVGVAEDWHQGSRRKKK